MNTLFDEIKIGSLTLPNRIIMAPLTRMRSEQPGNIPQALNTEYYKQRSSAGLIISEATQITQQGQGYPATPGIHSKEQLEGWKDVTSAVHQNGGRMFLQLWHVGRVPKNSGTMSSDWKPVALESPRALLIEEIQKIVQDFKNAAENALAAGFDGVEVHGANGYLLDQFLQDGSNKRDDAYGGSIENRARFLLEAVSAAESVFGKDRVGVRLSPYGTFNDMSDTDPIALFNYVFDQLSKKQIAYVHVIEPRASSAGGSDSSNQDAPSTSSLFKSRFNGAFISAGGYTYDLAKEAVENNSADAVAFGRLFIANPDLVERFKICAELNKYDRKTFYGGNEHGYTDYPFL